MEEISEVIRNGFGIWKRNLNLCIPFLYGIIALIFIAISLYILLRIADLPLALTDAYKFQGYSEHEAMLGLLLLLAAIITCLLIRLFFDIGAIGMARQALESGRSDTSSMWSTAKRHFRNMFLLSLVNDLLIWSAILVDTVFRFVIMERIAGAMPEISDRTNWWGWPLIGIVFVFALILVFVFLFTHLQATLILSTSVFALILSVVLSPAPYALVLEGLGPVQAIRAGVDFFRGNKLDVLILCAVTSALSLLIFLMIFLIGSSQMGWNLLAIMGLIAILADLLVLAPLTNLWWTRLYMVRKGMINDEDANDPHQFITEEAMA